MRRLIIGVALATGMFVAGMQAVGAGQVRETPPQTYTVRAGDTLWSIAGTIAPDSDRRAVVDDLMRLNELPSPTLLPGQTLTVPG